MDDACGDEEYESAFAGDFRMRACAHEGREGKRVCNSREIRASSFSPVLLARSRSKGVSDDDIG